MHRFATTIILILIAVGCGSSAEKADGPTALELLQQDNKKKNEITNLLLPPKKIYKILENGEPNYITIRQLLIGFEGSVYGKVVVRSKEEAQVLANDLYTKIKEGADLIPLSEEFSDSMSPVEYQLANFGVEGYRNGHVPSLNIYERESLKTKALSDASFKLEVGGYAMVEYDKEKNYRGWFIVKRIK